MNENFIKKSIIVRGKVQGVFFRKFTKDNAVELGVKGFVRNLRDGTVHCVAFGEKEAVTELIKRLQRGPDFSHVEAVMVEDYRGDDEFFTFEIRYSS